MYYNRKKAIIKNAIFIIAIFTLAIFATYNIYYHFINATGIDYSSKSLEIVFHEKNGAKVALTKATPVPDSVGLSSASYTFTIKNNLKKTISYKIVLEDDIEAMIADFCEETQLPKELLRVSIKENNEKNQIYTISELKDNVLENNIIKPQEEKNYAIRLWLTSSPTMNIGNDLHYHGVVKVVEEDTEGTIS